MEKQLIEEISDGVATLPFNRPDRLNALSTPIMEGLLEALPRLALGCRRRKGLTTLLAERHTRVRVAHGGPHASRDASWFTLPSRCVGDDAGRKNFAIRLLGEGQEPR